MVMAGGVPILFNYGSTDDGCQSAGSAQKHVDAQCATDAKSGLAQSLEKGRSSAIASSEIQSAVSEGNAEIGGDAQRIFEGGAESKPPSWEGTAAREHVGARQVGTPGGDMRLPSAVSNEHGSQSANAVTSQGRVLKNKGMEKCASEGNADQLAVKQHAAKTATSQGDAQKKEGECPPEGTADQTLGAADEEKGAARREKAEELARTLRAQTTAVFTVQMALLEGPTTAERLQASRRLLAKPEYDDLVKERAIAGVCGYPLCHNVLPEKSSRKGRYRISLAQKRVFDTAETLRFCCLDHVVRSGGFRATLEDERPLLPSGEELRAAVDAVTGRSERGLQSASEISDVTKLAANEEGSSAGPGVMSATLVERRFTPCESAAVQAPTAGNADAIEGYVPRRVARRVTSAGRSDCATEGGASLSSQGPSARKDARSGGLNVGLATQVRGPSVTGKNGERETGGKSGAGGTKSKFVKERQNSAGDLQKRGKGGSGSGPTEAGATPQDPDVEWSRRLDESAADAGISISRYADGGREERSSGETKSATGETKPVPVETKPAGSNPEPMERNPEPIESKPVTKGAKPAPLEMRSAHVEAKPIPVETRPSLANKEPGLVPRLPESGVTSSSFGVTEFLEKRDQKTGGKMQKEAGGNAPSVVEPAEKVTKSPTTGTSFKAESGLPRKSTSTTDSKAEQGLPDPETDLRLQSAQAVASALAEAAARVQSGDLDESEAMQMLGMTVQPANEGPPAGVDRDWGGNAHGGTEISGIEREGGTNEEPVSSGWVLKGLAPGRVLEKTDSKAGCGQSKKKSNAKTSSRPSVTPEEEEEPGQGWMGAPPKGFSAELSQFGNLWMAFDSWISAETLQFLRSTDSTSATSSTVNAGGREYGPRVVLENGASAAIRKAFQECVGRALPDVQRALQLKVPRPELEEALGDLARTFSFTDPLPPLKSPGWRFVTLLLLHSVSMQRAFSLQAYLKEDGPLFEKALSAYGSSVSEYKLLLEKLVP